MDYNLFKEELLLAIQDLADPEQFGFFTLY